MSEPKLYKHNESGEEVAIAKVGLFANVLRSDGTLSTHICKTITDNYTPLPEAPGVGSDEWAFSMMLKRKKVRKKSWDKKCFRWIDDNGNILDQDYNFAHSCFRANDWQLYESPKPIIEKLPHEFVRGQEVLVRDSVCREWTKRIFLGFSGHLKTHPFRTEAKVGDIGYYYCLTYAGNEHLEGQTTDGEHGAVPKGYVPPHVPKLGDDDYWQVGDEVVLLHNGIYRKIENIYNNKIFLNHSPKSKCYTINGNINENSMGLRVLYHKGSYVREDGTAHEHVPTRPHRIEEDPTL